jgi:hypothetical protein
MNSSNETGRTRAIRPICIAAGALCSLGLLHSAIALPLVSRAGSSTPISVSARSTPARGLSTAHQPPNSIGPLDLRPPRNAASPAGHGANALASEPFPSANHPGELGKKDLGGEDRRVEEGMRPSAFGAGEMSVHEMSQGQIIVERLQHMHREGLPVARLWVSQSAAVSIGLNQRGKPGLWFTQRMH